MRFVSLVIFTLLAAGSAFGQNTSFAISTGYSHVHFNRQEDGLFYSHDGAYVDGDFTWRVPGAGFPLLIGGGISGSGYYDFRHTFVPFSSGFFEDFRLDSQVGLLSLEGRVSAPMGLSHGRGIFVMPRLGMGLLVQDYSIDRRFGSGVNTFFSTDDHTGAAFEVRPTVQAGYSWGAGAAGVEVSYLAAWGDFGRLGNVAQEIRAGVFVRFSF